MAKGMTKSETLNALAEKTGKTRKEVGEMLEAIANLAYSEAKNNGEFTIPGLGKLAAKTVVKFRVAKAAKDAIL